jgi:glycosyltransferase involved in cell wall biosynthesis
MLTIFTLPKPFHGHIGMIQRNALRSWLALRPECEIVLLGDEEGIAEHAQEFDVRHMPDIARNEYGTPLLSDAFSQVARSARFPRLCYVNADIILPQGFLSCVQRIALPRFLMIGQRITISADSELDFRDDSVARAVQTEARQSGALDAPFGSDYFVFPRGILGPIPPFAVGRPYWDNWMIYRARELHVPVVDASECVLVIHQDHSYGHVPQRAGERWEGPEAERNKRLVTQAAQHFTVRHASWRLAGGRLTKRHWWHARDRDDVFDSVEVFKPWTRYLFRAMRLLMRRWDRRLIMMLVATFDGQSISGPAPEDQSEGPTPSRAQPERIRPGMEAERLRAMWPSSAQDRWMTAEHRPGLVSVIVPAYQRAGMISTSLDSVRAQTYRPLELVVVDDGSTDGTAAAVEIWRDSLPADPGFTVRVIYQENAGPPAARNTGLKHCTGEFIQFLDSDDLVHPEKVRAQVESLGRDDRIDVTYARTAYFTQAPDWRAEPYVTFPETDDRLLDAFLLGGCWLPASGLFKRRTCVALGPWDEAAPILEDWDYSIRLILGGGRLDFASDTFLLYRHDHLARPTVTGRQLSPRSLRGRYLLTIRWLSWIRDAGRLDQDIAFLFSDQLIDLAIASLSAGQAALGREIFRSLRREHLGAPVSRRAEHLYFLLAELPEWCSPTLLQVLRRALELKQIAAGPHSGANDS